MMFSVCHRLGEEVGPGHASLFTPIWISFNCPYGLTSQAAIPTRPKVKVGSSQNNNSLFYDAMLFYSLTAGFQYLCLFLSRGPLIC